MNGREKKKNGKPDGQATGRLGPLVLSLGPQPAFAVLSGHSQHACDNWQQDALECLDSSDLISLEFNDSKFFGKEQEPPGARRATLQNSECLGSWFL